jgi:hypothetical protein
MQGVLTECNRLAEEQEAAERALWARKTLLEIERRYLSGEIDHEEYLSLQDRIVRTLAPGSQRGESK